MAGSVHSTLADRQNVNFPNWKGALAAEPFAPEHKQALAQEIFAFLHHCKVQHAGASIILIQQYLAVAEGQGRTRAREALRWWFRAAKRSVGVNVRRRWPATILGTASGNGR